MSRGSLGFITSLLLLFCSSVGAQQWQWVQSFSGEGAISTQVGHDDAQNVYVAGTFRGTNSIGTNQVTWNTNHNVFIASFDMNGAPRWLKTAQGQLARMLVASNGSVFLCGALGFQDHPAEFSSTDTLLARLDGGALIWELPLEEGLPHAAHMALGPDETIYLLENSGQPGIRRYTQSGLLLDRFMIQRDPFTPRLIAIGPSEEIYVGGRFVTNSIPYHFTARVSGAGEVIWLWRPAGSAYSPGEHIQDIAATPDGGVVSVGFYADGIQRTARMVKHSMDGTREWGTGLSRYGKSYFSADAVTADHDGNIHVTGYADRNYSDGDRLMVLTLSPTGEHLTDERIHSYYRRDANSGRAIAVDKSGAVLVAGTLSGWPIFGTNRLTSAGGFVARRFTVLPKLLQHEVGNEVALSWPATALPFALQQSDDDGLNWSFVAQPPERTGDGNQVVLPVTPETWFRLLRTNEVPPRYPPQVTPLGVPSAPFLSRSNVVIAGPPGAASAVLRVWFSDDDSWTLNVSWTNAFTGRAVTNAFSVSRHSPYEATTMPNPNYYHASVAVDSSDFPPGWHSVSVSVSDGTSTVTKFYPEFEVISAEMALQEFFAVMESLRSDRAGLQAWAFLESYSKALAKERERAAQKRWIRFQRLVHRIGSLSDDDRALLLASAERVKVFLPHR